MARTEPVTGSDPALDVAKRPASVDITARTPSIPGPPAEPSPGCFSSFGLRDDFDPGFTGGPSDKQERRERTLLRNISGRESVEGVEVAVQFSTAVTRGALSVH